MISSIARRLRLSSASTVDRRAREDSPSLSRSTSCPTAAAASSMAVTALSSSKRWRSSMLQILLNMRPALSFPDSVVPLLSSKEKSGNAVGYTASYHGRRHRAGGRQRSRTDYQTSVPMLPAADPPSCAASSLVLWIRRSGDNVLGASASRPSRQTVRSPRATTSRSMSPSDRAR